MSFDFRGLTSVHTLLRSLEFYSSCCIRLRSHGGYFALLDILLEWISIIDVFWLLLSVCVLCFFV